MLIHRLLPRLFVIAGSEVTWSYLGGSNNTFAYGTTDWPSARLDTSVWVDADGTAAYMIGGEGLGQQEGAPPGLLASLWEWSLHDQSSTTGWRWLGGSNYSGNAASHDGPMSSQSFPGARSRSIAFVDPLTSTAWILGGYGYGKNSVGVCSLHHTHTRTRTSIH